MRILVFVFAGCLLSSVAARGEGYIDLAKTTIVIHGGEVAQAEKISPVILAEEVAKRTGLAWAVTENWPQSAAVVIALSVAKNPPAWKEHIPAHASAVLTRPESFAIRTLPAHDGKCTRIFV